MTRRTLNVSLTPELEDLISSKVASGRYLSASEVVRDGLRLLEERDRLRREALDHAREKIDAGLASLDRGEGVAADEVFAEIEGNLERRARRPKKR
jgi:antitoxin ParD1/3/4